ncbi:oxysterol-binding protein-related protein 10 [Anguilla anguilla]|uniref:oxysterol-binding protein-related protein 10 n=1 Tax=Anguilla anguilla TaxID=7936 RepID=UPI0015AFD4D6|nr:oxysterol-binding protein-related protein 10 [Anguilla anguilla]XP_035245310.1 oxysterol-binding protein-related protein 10 [Anguilla anguilla]
MEKALGGSHPGNSKSNSGSACSSDPGNSTQRLGRSGSHSPGSGSSGSPAGGGGSCGGVSRNNGCMQQSRKRYLEGVLSKYTNLLQGWQNRYFVLDPEVGQLQYFVSEPCRGQKPRGSLPLIGASVAQCDEAPHMFTVYSANGDLYKLRAADAREQQYWMSQLQACVRRHSDSSAKGSSCASSSRTRSFSLLPHPLPTSSSSPGSQRHPSHTGAPSAIVTITHHKSPAAARRAKNQYSGRLLEVKEVISQAEGQQKTLVHSIESLPTRGPLSSLDQDLLLLKATSAATLSCLGECLNILQQNVGQVTQHSHAHGRSLVSDAVPGWPVPTSPSAEQLNNGGPSPSMPQAGTSVSLSSEPSPALRDKDLTPSTDPPSLEAIHPSEEATDTEENEEEELGVMEDQRSVILHLLSQLKLGMDLTRVVLPTFILEKRSLLEMYANFMAHPDMFLSITAAVTAEERIVRFVEYYLTSFHEGRKGAVAKKPYNPILGESFHCSWEVPCDRVRPARTNSGPALRDPAQAERCGADTPGCYRVRFVAEQVSHHPPVSGFYCECQERRMCVNAHVWTKSKFMGMSIGVSMVGEGVLCLLEHDEEYVFTLPCAYARSILTVPWVELGGKVSINCAKSGYSATVTFHTKPFYGGKVHRVTAEVKHNPTNTIVCKAQGEWNGTLEFTYSSGETKVIDTSKLPIIKKKIRPVERQGLMESRRLWHPVTEALKEGNVDTATKHKHLLEERQRSEERQRAASNTPWKPRYFIKEGEGWVYHSPLWKTH